MTFAPVAEETHGLGFAFPIGRGRVLHSGIEVAAAPAPVAAASTQETAGERRHVAVMFCDLVDFTGIAAKLDAEEWRDLVGTYFHAASAAR